MTSPTNGSDRPVRDLYSNSAPKAGHTPASPDTGHGAHRWMMLICCIPMVVIVALLVVSGAAGSGTVLLALGCVAMMAAMMFMMPGGHDQ